MDDRSDVKQSPVLLQVANVGTATESVIGFTLPMPPDGCESMQLIHHGAVTAHLMAPHCGLMLRLRSIEAYATLWGIEMERLNLVDFVTRSAEQPTQ